MKKLVRILIVVFALFAAVALSVKGQPIALEGGCLLTYESAANTGHVYGLCDGLPVFGGETGIYWDGQLLLGFGAK